MKKYLSLILALVMCFSISTTVFAQDQFVSEGTAEATVTYHADSFYMVMIPETIDANATMTLSAAQMNIDDNEIVRVKVTNLNASDLLQLTHSRFGGTAGFELYRSDINERIANQGDVATFISGILEPSYGVNFLSHDPEMQAGDYSGTITFSISLMSMN